MHSTDLAELPLRQRLKARAERVFGAWGVFAREFFKHPRMDRELLSQHGKGIIGTTGCPSGEIQVHLRHGNYAAARQAAGDFQEILGKDRPDLRHLRSL